MKSARRNNRQKFERIRLKLTPSKSEYANIIGSSLVCVLVLGLKLRMYGWVCVCVCVLTTVY